MSILFLCVVVLVQSDLSSGFTQSYPQALWIFCFEQSYPQIFCVFLLIKLLVFKILNVGRSTLRSLTYFNLFCKHCASFFINNFIKIGVVFCRLKMKGGWVRTERWMGTHCNFHERWMAAHWKVDGYALKGGWVRIFLFLFRYSYLCIFISLVLYSALI